ncbi:MAG: hypothetical protein AMXMBFR20_15650 [Planctomycetia bacterium]|nr:hypothetical protein [Planctomycetota bacterium]OQZ01735.1 MAG: hypothetical protein B6D36_13800 [Planctomycetes bacterium UTPLA1]
MKSMTRIACIAALGLTLCGCLPEKRIVWSPDGSRAAVATPTGLYLIDATGKLLKPRISDTPTRCVWTADGKGLLVAHAQKAAKWDELTKSMSAAEKEMIESTAVELRKRILEHDGDWEKFELDPDKKLSAGMEAAAVLCLRDKHAEGVKEKLGDKWEDIEKVDAPVWKLTLFDVTEEKLVERKTLFQGLDEIRAPSLSPNGRLAGFLWNRSVASDDEDLSSITRPLQLDQLSLNIVPTDGAKPARLVANKVAIDYDWSPDSRSLAFIHGAPSMEEGSRVELGSLATTTVADDEGRLLDKWEEKDRVGMLFNPMLSVRWLRDGRLLFSSVEVTLPVTTRAMPQEWTLFVMDPRTPASVMRVLGRDLAEPREPETPVFSLSPDEKRVLLPGPNGRVTLYEFTTGETTALVSTQNPKGGAGSIPSWRNNEEITFVMPQADAQSSESSRPEVHIWKAGKSRCISKDWPEEMRTGWLENK